MFQHIVQQGAVGTKLLIRHITIIVQQVGENPVAEYGAIQQSSTGGVNILYHPESFIQEVNLHGESPTAFIGIKTVEKIQRLGISTNY